MQGNVPVFDMRLLFVHLDVFQFSFEKEETGGILSRGNVKLGYLCVCMGKTVSKLFNWKTCSK